METSPFFTSASWGSSPSNGPSITDSMSGSSRRRSSNCSRMKAMPHPSRRPVIRPMAASLDLESPVEAPGWAATWIVA